jgi:hypothetical protein
MCSIREVASAAAPERGMGMPEMETPAHLFVEQEAVEAADEGHDALQQLRAF